MSAAGVLVDGLVDQLGSGPFATDAPFTGGVVADNTTQVQPLIARDHGLGVLGTRHAVPHLPP